MRTNRDNTTLASLAPAALALATLALIISPAMADSPGDFDGSEYVDLADVSTFLGCVGGPEVPPPGGCEEADFDPDGDIDLRDLATFQTLYGHTPIPLKDVLGNVLAVDSTNPYSGRQTCGGVGCHDLDDPAGITNGKAFQQGRTDMAGNVIMKDDYFEDGRWWMRSPGRFGVWSQAMTWQMAGKENENESVFDESAFHWTSNCSGCHVGGGSGEFDRDGELLYNEATGQFGYEVLGKTPEEVVLDGDYANFNYSTNTMEPARWDLTGLSGPDCLFCHRREPPTMFWRQRVLGAGTELVDDLGDPVKAFAAAATAGQRWFSTLDWQADPVVLQIDYSVGVADGSLIEGGDGTVYFDNARMERPPLDTSCWMCHIQKESLDGMVWFDETPDVHYRKFNNLSDEDPGNDIPGDRSKACTNCHPGGLDHNFAKGNDFMFTWRDELDWVDLRTCRNCHLWDSPDRHADAPEVGGGTDTLDVHLTRGMMNKLSCQACHIPYALNHAMIYLDTSAGGWSSGMTSQYLSADPLDPTNPDKNRWYPALMWKTDSDGVERLFPCVPWPVGYWADWDQNGTPEDLSDDVLTPIILWRLFEAIGGAPLPVVTDDNGDGSLEINRPEEILAYIEALKGNDSYGRQVAARPVQIKGRLIWHEDPGAPEGVSSFEHEGTGIPVEWWYYNWGLDHNVLPATEAWGAGRDCQVCHRTDGQSWVFDRLVLVDPYDPDGQPVYETVREMTDIVPYHGEDVVLKDSLGNPIMLGSSVPYSGRQTCGGIDCHDIDLISNGMKFQQGRTDLAGNVIMQDDHFGDGRWWQRSPGRFGIWSQATTLQMAGKDNANESVFDQSAFAWMRDCSGCHPGGGPGEFDRDGELLYNEVTGQFGYEVLGKTPAEVVLDGDYADFDYATSTVVPARWDLTGLADPDCLYCHRTEAPNVYWREAALGGATQIVDNVGNPVKGFAAAATAGQQWVSNIEIVHEGFTPEATVLQIDYSVGVADGSLVENPDGSVGLAPGHFVNPPLDQACWICHVQKESLDGMVWYDDTPDVHYRYINKLSDEDPNNDIPGTQSQACNYCHPGGPEHNVAKGNGFEFRWRDEEDWANFRTCRNCHMAEDPPGTPNPLKHADAPEPVHPIHIPELVVGDMINKVSCQGCHIPYALNYALLYFDSTAGGILWDTMCCVGFTFQYLSADPLDPANPDKSRWYPALMWKTDVDGVDRLFPTVPWPNIHWADWDQNATPGDLSDDLLTPIIEWRMYEVIGSEPLAVATDDDGDGRVEINRPEEILAYIDVLKGYDSYGRQVAANPVLVKGDRVWYEDPGAPDGVSYFEHEGTGIPVEWYYYNWGLDHNVLPAVEAWGTESGTGADNCGHCHFFHAGGPTPVFDRLILVDPYDLDGQPRYKTVRDIAGVDPP